MTKLIVSFMGIMNLVPDEKVKKYVVWVPDLRGRPQDMDHEPVLVVEKENASWPPTLKPAGEDSRNGLVSFSLHGETFRFGPSSGSITRTNPFARHALRVEDACATDDQGDCKDFDPKSLKPALTAFLDSGDLDACWIDHEYSWTWKRGGPKWLAEEVCLTTTHDDDEITLPFVNQGDLTVRAGGDDQSIQIRIVNYPLAHLRNHHHDPAVDHHSILYYEWSTLPVPPLQRRALQGKKEDKSVKNHAHRFNGESPVPLPPHALPPNAGEMVGPYLVGGTNCPPGDWYP